MAERLAILFLFPLLFGDKTTGQRLFRDVRDKDKRTALHLAAIMDRDTTVKLLMDLGSDPGLRDCYCETPLKHMIVNMPSVVRNGMGEGGRFWFFSFHL